MRPIPSQPHDAVADYLAATVAGTDATTSALTRITLSEHFEGVLAKSAYSPLQSGSDIFDLFRSRIASLPNREWERLRRAAKLEGARLDSSHPPTAHRIAFLEAHAAREPKMHVSDATMQAIDAELGHLEEKLGDRLIARVERQ